MKTYLSILFFIIASNLVLSQKNYCDVVYLKNGEVKRGIIVENIPNSLIKIKTSDKNIFVYRIEEIEKFTKEPCKERTNNLEDDFGL